MAIEQDLGRIATALETLVALYQGGTVAASAATKKPTTKAATTKAAAVAEETKPKEETKTDEEAIGDRYTNTRAYLVAKTFEGKKAPDVKAHFFQTLCECRDSLAGAKPTEAALEEAKKASRAIGEQILSKYTGGKTVTQDTLPADKFVNFIYDLECLRV